MPIFSYRCSSCENQFDAVLKISDRKNPTLSPCQTCGESTVEQFISQAPGLAATAYTNLKPPDGFKDILKKVKKENPRSTIDV